MNSFYKPHSSTAILDSTKINSYMACPRLFFLEHQLGWRKEGGSFHMDYGTCMHEALATLYTYLQKDGHYSANAVMAASETFEKVYKETFGGDTLLGVYTDPNNDSPKSLSNGLLAIEQYSKRYSADRFISIEHVETVGTIPINEKDRIHFKLDTLVQTAQGFRKVIEHKTASRDSQSEQAHWPLAFQIGTYLHVLYLLYGREAEGVVVDIIILRQKGNEFRRVPCSIQLDRMQDWLEDANHYVSLIKQEQEMFLLWAKPEARQEQIMPCFRKRTCSCLRYGECPFMNFCISYQNPLKATDGTFRPAAGFYSEFWDPRDMEKKEGVRVVEL